MGLADAHAAVQNERVVAARLFAHLQGCGEGQLICGAGDEVIEIRKATPGWGRGRSLASCLGTAGLLIGGLARPLGAFGKWRSFD